MKEYLQGLANNFKMRSSNNSTAAESEGGVNGEEGGSDKTHRESREPGRESDSDRFESDENLIFSFE